MWTADNITSETCDVTTVNIGARIGPVTRSYHHGNLRPALVEAAAELARAQGPDGVVLREVARRTGVSHNAAYRHFADREELLAEVAAAGMDGLEQAMLRPVGDGPHPGPVAPRGAQAARDRARLRASSRSPSRDSSEWPSRRTWASAEGGPYALLNAALDELVEVGAMPPDRRAGADVRMLGRRARASRCSISTARCGRCRPRSASLRWTGCST